MSNLIVYTYNHKDQAGDVLQEVAAMKQEHVQRPLLNIEDAAFVVKNDKGKVKVHQTLESAMKGTEVVSGGFWGLLVGFLFGGPLFGGLLGMGLSALMGRKVDIGIDNQFIEDVSNDLKAGDSALFLLVGEITPIETIETTLNKFGGRIYHTSFSRETNEVMTTAAESDALAESLVQEQNA